MLKCVLSIVELQRVRLRILLMIFDGFDLHVILIWRLMSQTIFLEKTSSKVELCMYVNTQLLWGLLIDFQNCYYVSCNFSVIVSLYYTFYLLKPGMNQQVNINPLMKFIYMEVLST